MDNFIVAVDIEDFDKLINYGFEELGDKYQLEINENVIYEVDKESGAFTMSIIDASDIQLMEDLSLIVELTADGILKNYEIDNAEDAGGEEYDESE